MNKYKLLFWVPLTALLMGISSYHPGGDGIQDSLELRNSANTFGATFAQPTLTADRTITIPDADISLDGGAMHQVLTDGTTITWDQSAGTFATLTLTDAVGTRTLNITNDVVGQSFLILIQDATDGGELIATWDASIKWTVGIDPTLSTGTSEQDVVVLFSDGTTQYGFTGYDYQ